jgi:hypothetical protein
VEIKFNKHSLILIFSNLNKLLSITAITDSTRWPPPLQLSLATQQQKQKNMYSENNVIAFLYYAIAPIRHHQISSDTKLILPDEGLLGNHS